MRHNFSVKNSFFNFFLLLTLIFLFKISLLNFDSLNRNTTTVSIENSKFSSAPLSKPLITDIEIEVENDQEEKESSPSDEFSKENNLKNIDVERYLDMKSAIKNNFEIAMKYKTAEDYLINYEILK